MNKKKNILLIVIILLTIFCIFLGYLLFNKYISKTNFENSVLSFANKNEKSVFKIQNITYFSGCDSLGKSSSVSNFTIENLYQYTDIAIFISGTSQNKSLENTLKKVSISNIQFTSSPLLGKPVLYFKSINNFAKSDIHEENYIKDNLDFNISSADDTNLDNPTLYNNLANPITLSYVNKNIKSDYTITDTSSPITYNGSLLKRCNVNLDDLRCKFSFDVNITNNLDENFKSTIFIDIPLINDDNKSIFDGSLIKKEVSNYIFYKF